MHGTRGRSLCSNIAHYLNREIGDEELLLDNLDLDRNAKFQAQYKVKAGKWVNPLYEYPNKLSSLSFASYSDDPWPTTNPYLYSLSNNGIFSKEDPFRILPNTTAVLIAEDSLIDLGIDEQGTMTPEYSFQWVCSENYSDSTVYQKRSSEPSMEVDKVVFQTSAFPNPTHRGDPLSVKGVPEGLYAISLQNLNGKLLLFDELAIEKEEFIHVTVPAHIHAGIYLLRLQNNDQVFTFKISVL